MSTPSKLSTQADCRTEHVLEADCPKCNRSIIVPIDRFKNPEYINWVTSNVCMQYMKEGIEGMADDVATLLFKDVADDIQSASKCSQCSNLENMKKCKGKDCQTLMRHLADRCCKPLNFKNKTGSGPISDIKSWDLATLYMSNTTRKLTKPSDADSTALLSFMENCFLSGKVIDDPGVFKDARSARNEIVHNGYMKLRESEFKDYTGKFLDVLKDKNRLENDEAYHNAKENIERLLGNEMKIELVKKEEDRVVKQHRKEFAEIVEHLDEELATTKDKDEIEKIQQKLTHMAETQTRKESMMEIYNVRSDADVETKKKITLISERAVKKRIDMETSSITEERNKLAEECEQTKGMLKKVEMKSEEKDKLLEKMKKTNQLKDVEFNQLFKEVEESLKEASKDDKTIEKINQNMKQTKERLSKLEQESKEETGWICECGLLNKGDSSKCILCDREKDSRLS